MTRDAVASTELPDDTSPHVYQRSWRRRGRRLAQLLPLLIALVAGISAIAVFAGILAGKNQDAFLGAVVGSALAFYGALLVQYLAEVLRSWREVETRERREAGILSALMSELGEVAVVLETNAAGGKSFLAPTEQWLTLRLQVGELWMPNTVFRLSTVYIKIKLLNDQIAAHLAISATYSKSEIELLLEGAHRARAMSESLKRRVNRLGAD